jgi:hypothetical protein
LFEQYPASPEPGSPASATGSSNNSTVANGVRSADLNSKQSIQSETEALNDLRAIPLYFASSYALVKPYVSGFDSNVLDIPSLKHVRIDTNWREPKSTVLSSLK